MAQCLIAKNVSFSYGRAEVLHEASLTLVRGRVHMLLGPSGCGKTTLLWIIAGLLRPTAGRVMFGEVNGDGLKTSETCPTSYPLAGLGMAFQQPGLWEHLSAIEHLTLVLKRSPLSRAARKQAAMRTLQSLGIADLAASKPAQMSGGERQRLALARAIINKPCWLLLDEPLAHLDQMRRQQLLELLAATTRQLDCAVLMSTHDPQVATRLGHDITIMSGGRVLQSGAMHDVYRNPCSLEAALAMGSAIEVAGMADAGKLVRNGLTILEGLDRSLSGACRMILRPADVEAAPDPAGPAQVVRHHWIASGCEMVCTSGGQELLAWHRHPLPAGTAVRLRLLGSA